jgi:hypothetical protein
VDPHGTQFSDALAKLKGLAKYAETHSQVFRRIETVAKVDDTLRVLDLTDPEIRRQWQTLKMRKVPTVAPWRSDCDPRAFVMPIAGCESSRIPYYPAIVRKSFHIALTSLTSDVQFVSNNCSVGFRCELLAATRVPQLIEKLEIGYI